MSKHIIARSVRGHQASSRVATLPTEHPMLTTLWQALLVTLRMTGWTALAITAVSALYLAKSALGIDILPGPSPLHDLLFPLLRR